MNKSFINHNNPDTSHLSRIDKPTIGLDLDGVLCNTRHGFLEEIESIYNININKQIYNDSNLNIPHIQKDYGTLIREIVHQDPTVYLNMDPIKGSSNTTHKLKEYYNIKIITHRVHDNWLTPEKLDELKSISIKWLNDNNIYFDEFVYPTPKDKSTVDADIYVDDRYNNIDNVLNKSDTNIGVLYIRPHNTNSIPWNSWLASSEISKDVNYISNNDKEQWNIITDSFTEYVQ